MSKGFPQSNKETAKTLPWRGLPYLLECRKCGGLERRKNHRAFDCKYCTGEIAYPRNWKSLRKLVLDRDGHKCTVCKRRDVSLHIHHVDKNTKNNKLSNLETKCNQCHPSNHKNRHFVKKVNYHDFGVRLEYSKVPIIDVDYIKSFCSRVMNNLGLTLT